MKTLVIGGKGYVGTHLVKRLKKEGHNVATFDIVDGQDAMNLPQVLNAVKGMEVVYHLANVASIAGSYNEPWKTLTINLTTTLNVAEACKNAAATMVFLSSYAVCEACQAPYREWMINPKSPYGLSKAMCENLIESYHRLYDLDARIIRTTNLYGGDDKNVPHVLIAWLKAKKKGEDLQVNGAKTTRDFTHIDDLTDVLVKLKHEKIAFCDTHNVSGGLEVNLYDAARAISDKVYVNEKDDKTTTRVLGNIERTKNVFNWKPKHNFWKDLPEYVKERL